MSKQRDRSPNPKTAAKTAHAPIMAVNEAAEALPGEWVFLQVTEND